MSDKSEGQKPEDIDASRAGAKVAVGEIAAILPKFDEQLKAWDAARKNVDEQVAYIRAAVATAQGQLEATADLKGVTEVTKGTLNDIKSIRTQVEEQLKAAETARKSA